MTFRVWMMGMMGVLLLAGCASNAQTTASNGPRNYKDPTECRVYFPFKTCRNP
ncbi:MAG: hypothetical protein OEV94_05555 [Deltaproteobacteria bacterium]|nr:hypothetical protein [Deltaproteobacteria bacterium]